MGKRHTKKTKNHQTNLKAQIEILDLATLELEKYHWALF